MTASEYPTLATGCRLIAMVMRTLLLLAVLAAPLSAVAQARGPDSTERRSLSTDASDGPVGPSVGEWSLQVSGSFFRESWDLNAFREQLLGASVGAFRQLTPRWAIGFEANFLHVRQNPLRDVLLPAGNALLRWSALQLGKTTVFAEGGGGLSYASGMVPNEGTRFNFVSQTGVGVMRSISRRVDVVGGARWLHVSNNGLDGSRRNPDIQALGLYIGWSLH